MRVHPRYTRYLNILNVNSVRRPVARMKRMLGGYLYEHFISHGVTVMHIKKLLRMLNHWGPSVCCNFPWFVKCTVEYKIFFQPILGIYLGPLPCGFGNTTTTGVYRVICTWLNCPRISDLSLKEMFDWSNTIWGFCFFFCIRFISSNFPNWYRRFTNDRFYVLPLTFTKTNARIVPKKIIKILIKKCFYDLPNTKYYCS